MNIDDGGGDLLGFFGTEMRSDQSQGHVFLKEILPK